VKINIRIYFTFLLIVVSSLARSEESAYSASATIACLRDSKPLKIQSPDGVKAIVVTETYEGASKQISLEISGKEHVVDRIAWPCPEILWSPDSKAFFINYSDGGSVGNYHVRVYKVEETASEPSEPIKEVRKDFLKNYPKCYAPEEPNYAGLQWVHDSNRLLIAAEVLPHSTCDMMGTFSIYEIDASDANIKEKYSQLESKSKFRPLLGRELLNADDECFTKPHSCEIPDLHGKQREVAIDAKCFRYDQKSVTLTGVVVIETFYGPPNYGENPDTDAKEKQAILKLDVPMCVNKSSRSPIEEAEHNQNDVTLVPMSEVNFGQFANKHVQIIGKLYHAKTSHHHTPVLLSVWDQPILLK
jgi:hypothetical protein